MPGDPEIEDMDPLLRQYLYFQWVEDHRENVEFYKNLGYLIGSFIHPEAVSKLTNGNTIQSTDEDFDKATEVVRQSTMEAQAKEAEEFGKLKKRKRKSIQ